MKNIIKSVTACSLILSSTCFATDFDSLKNIIENSSSLNDSFTTSIDFQDHKNVDMDVLKIVSADGSMNDLLGVFHTHLGKDNHNAIYLVKNTTGDLKTGWEYISQLSDSGSMGYLYPYNNGYVFAYEHEDNSGNTVAISYFDSQDSLVANKYNFQYWLDKNVYLAKDDKDTTPVKNMGTPSIEGVSKNSDQIDFKIHYFPNNGELDKPAYGTVNIPGTIFNPDDITLNKNYGNSAQHADIDVSNAIKSAGGVGKIGQRDWFDYNNHRFYIYEAQTCSHDFESSECWASWRLFLYDPITNHAQQLTLGGCETNSAFANPHTIVIGNKLILSAFIPSETKSKTCNGAGEFIRSIDLT